MCNAAHYILQHATWPRAGSGSKVEKSAAPKVRPSPATGALCSSLPVDASGAPQVICERVVHEVQLLRVGELAVRRKQLPIGAAAYSSNAELGAATLACCPPAMRLASAAVATEAQPGGGVELVHVFAREVGAVRQMVLALVLTTRGR